MGKIFDSSLKNIAGNKMSERTIGILKYILENDNAVKIDVFEKEIWDYLKKNYNHKENDSMIEHFYRPLLFYGLLRDIDNTLSLSIDGKMFINHINNKKYHSAMKCFINQIIKTSYPNKATKFVDISLYPFKNFF